MSGADDARPSREYLELALLGLQGLPDVWVVFFDSGLRCVLAAGGGLAGAGFDAATIEGRLASEVLGPERAGFWEPYYRAALRGESVTLEVPAARGERWYEVRVAPWMTAGGERLGGLSFGRDITDRVEVEGVNAGLAAIVEASDDAIIGADADGRITSWNRGARQIFGHSAGDAIGQPISTVLPGSEKAEPDELLARVRTGERVRMDGVAHRRTGRMAVEVSITMSPVVDARGRVVGVGVVARDITERERGERARALWGAVVESVDDAIVSTTLEGTITSWNPAAERIYGYRAADMIGHSSQVLVPSGREDEQRGLLAAVASGGRPLRIETTRRRKDGRLIEVAETLSPVHDVAGALVGLAALARDITEDKRAEHERGQALGELERLAQAAEFSGDAVVSLDLDMRVQRWNAGAERLFGYRAEEVVGRPFRELSLAVEDGEETKGGAGPRDVMRTGKPHAYQARRRRKDGSVIDVQVTLTPWLEGGEVIGITAVAVDVTEHKRVERAREQALRDLEEAERLNRVGSWTWNPSSDTATWSRQLYELFGRDPALGPATAEAFLGYVHPDDRERIAAGYAEVFGGGPEFEFDYRVIVGGRQHILHARGRSDPLRPGCYLGTVQDVSEQRLAERERTELLEASIRSDSANRAKSEFLALMSHELRTPLNAIIGFSQLLDLEDLEPHQHEQLDYVLKASRHLLELINEVLDIARIETGRLTISPEPVVLADAVRDVLTLVAPLARDREVTVSTDMAGLADDGHVHADSNRLKQVLLNLLTNAIKYNRTGGSVRISFQITEAGRVRTLIADTGIGIARSQLDKLFEPFERLGAEGTEIEGTGLGLALSKGLIEAMGGTIEVESQPGQGSTFTIELACARAPSDAQTTVRSDRSAGDPDTTDGDRHRILYIEDNLSNLTLVERILGRRPGIELLPAMQGTIGLELARRHNPALILLDLHLPDLPGTEVLTRLKTEQSTRDIPVIVLTADASKGQGERVERLGAAAYLTKPLDVRTFLDTITTIINTPSAGPG